MEREPQPQFEFPWKMDMAGMQYLDFNTVNGPMRAHPETTLLYLYPDQPEYDHFFVILGENGDGTWKGGRFWRRLINDVFDDERAFGALAEWAYYEPEWSGRE